ncbi:hypothetical protein K435DRAFT_806994 [Dendrothele bispora CBS 962.96]|uniref:Uncharacterized protein n=1 Tax=Dendrothele bispora (strain CBS 962.96) TaxID=1314807 RepID=A0A4S8L7E2_DENBC|nr:hypothetical protein K435DRAFT_806994 [Dendrothele bispora CBS 962.96]
MVSMILEQRILFKKLISELLDTVEEDEIDEFTQAEVRQLVQAMDMPAQIHCPESRNKEGAVIALCILLRRLAYPTCLYDVQMQSRSPSDSEPVQNGEYHGMKLVYRK